MICLTCADSIFALQPQKIACLSNKTLGLTLGPSKGGTLHPSLNIFCPEGHAYLPEVDGGSCKPCTNPDCSRCFKTDLGKCLGCKRDIFRRKTSSDTCTTATCDANQYFTEADGGKCVDFTLPNCLSKDQHGWCDKQNGVGCLGGQIYMSGSCCTQTIDLRDLSSFPGKCQKCDSSCQSCSGPLASDCITCPSFSKFRLNGTSCETCTSSLCLKCDSDPNVCDITYSPLACRDRCTTCDSIYKCNTAGCPSGYVAADLNNNCIACVNGCLTCTGGGASNCSTCRPNFTLSGSNCNCSTAGYKQNSSLTPYLCNLCPASCSNCTSDNVCSGCVTQFKFSSGVCSCQTTNGFRQVSASNCDRCQKGCSSCSSSVTTCSGVSCRPGYVGFPNCYCPIDEGFVEDVFPDQGEPRICSPCTAGPGCHQCLFDKSICSGCRLNFILQNNSCVCPTAEGYRLDTVASPNTCLPCLVSECLTCSSGQSVCDVGGCRENFLLQSNTCVCPTTDGFRLDTTVVPNVCQPCLVQHCSICTSDQNVCEIGGCRANFILQSNTCVCPTLNGYMLNTSNTPQTCEICTVQNCLLCTQNANTCDYGGCRPNFILNLNSCTCDTQNGFRLASAQVCEACLV